MCLIFITAVKYWFLKQNKEKTTTLNLSCILSSVVDEQELQTVVCRLKRSRVTAERKAGMLFWWCKWRATISPRVLENSVSISCMVPLELWIKCKNKTANNYNPVSQVRPPELLKLNKITLKLLLSEGNCQVCISVCCMSARSQQEGGSLNLCGLIKRNEEQLGAMEWRRKGWGKRDKVIKAMQGGRKVARSRVPWHAEKI